MWKKFCRISEEALIKAFSGIGFAPLSGKKGKGASL
jgi:hypothetical protein